MDLPKSRSYLIDTNILIYSIAKKSKYNKEAKNLLKTLADGDYQSYICTQNILEALRVATHKKFEQPMGHFAISKAISIWVNNFELIFEDESVWIEFKKLNKKYKPKGNNVFDLWLVSNMLAYNIDSILTLNIKDFNGINEIKAINPL